MCNSSPSFRPCRSAMTDGISSGTPGPSAGLTSRARCSQLNEPTSSSIWHDPPSRKNPCVPPPGASTGVKAATIGMTASAPVTSACSRLTVSIGNRSLTFGRNLDHPDVGGVGERRAE